MSMRKPSTSALLVNNFNKGFGFLPKYKCIIPSLGALGYPKTPKGPGSPVGPILRVLGPCSPFC